MHTKAIALSNDAPVWYFMMRLCTQRLLHEVLLYGSDVKVREICTLHDGHDPPE